MRVVTFRFDGHEEDVKAAIAMITEAGVPIIAKHEPRLKRRGGTGVFWDGQIVLPDKGDVRTTQADATRLDRRTPELPGRTALPRRRRRT